ncbi:MAG: aminopeptidase [Chloroflexi bacterium]|nr:aminopeptidase [Chloroflexota bacterium]
MLEQTEAIRLIVDTCIRIKPEEDLLIVADDYARPRAIADAVAAAARARGAKVVYLVAPPKQNNAEEPRKTTVAAMLAADAVFGAGEKVTPISGHTAVHETLRARGGRLYATLGLSEDYLRKPFSERDIFEMKERAERLAQLFTQADVIKVTTPQGTDLTMSVKGRSGTVMHPINGVFLPDYAESPVAPVEGTASGTLVYDVEVNGSGHLLSTPLVVRVARGRVADISGNPEDVARLSRIVATDADAGNIGEFAIGASHTVPRRPTGVRYDCAILGTAHIGIGRNVLLGGKSASRSHIDAIVTRPTVELDGKAIVRDGEVLIR